MNKIEKEIYASLQELSQVAMELKTERDMLRKENEYLKSLIEKLTEKSTPYISPPQPNTWWTSNTPKGCPKCGIGSDGKAYGYVCSDPTCPTKVTCT